MLQYGGYPQSLKSRILSDFGHLSNVNAGRLLDTVIDSSVKYVFLGHLSKESNFPELAYKTVIDELCANNFDENKIKVGIANRSNPSEILNLEVS